MKSAARPGPTVFLKKHGRWILAGLAVAVVAAIWFVLPVKEWLQPFNAWADQAGPWGMCVFIAVYALGTVLFMPGSLLTIGAGLVFGFWRGMLVVMIGSTSGATLAFLMARYALRARVEAYAKKNAKFKAMDEAIADQGWKMVALLRLSPLVPYNLSNYLYGVTDVKLPQYVLASCVGMLPGTILYVYLGSIGSMASGSHPSSPWKWALYGAGVLATAAVTIWISRLARRTVTSKPKASRKPTASRKPAASRKPSKAS